MGSAAVGKRAMARARKSRGAVAEEVSGRDPVFGRPYADATRTRLAASPLAGDANVRILGAADENLYSLMGLADAGLTITSQSAELSRI